MGSRAALNGILSVLQTGAHWKDFPDAYPPYQNCHRCFQRWVDDGTFQTIVIQPALQVFDNHGSHQTKVFIDGTFVSEKKGVLALVSRSAALEG